MKYKNLEEVVKQLRGAVKAHGKQADIIEGHIKDMDKGKPGFPKRKFAPDQLKAIWASKHERGEA